MLPTGITLSTFYVEVNKICICSYVQCQRATLPPMFRGIWILYGYPIYIHTTIIRQLSLGLLGHFSYRVTLYSKVQLLWRKYIFIKTSCARTVCINVNFPVHIQSYTFFQYLVWDRSIWLVIHMLTSSYIFLISNIEL